ncbi:MAG: S1 RNA-binding domain-containing protein, partial [Cytophagales bacterium]|nr:S1 RNA-binding domain-containing protein [Cytophagales bacterium]
GPQLAQNIVSYRNEHGPFKRRKDLKKVPRLGEKAFEQSAGFLRIRGAENPLDSSAVHPESYSIVEQMAKDKDATVQELMRDKSLRASVELQKYLSDSVGLPTLQDIISELEKPGLDPRDKFEPFAFMDGVHEIEDLRVGMKLPGIVTNITNFGAFVDVGVHQDGLVHVSQISDDYCSNPAEKVQVQQKVMVTVTGLDVARRRISLSMKSSPLEEKKVSRPKVNKANTRIDNRTDSDLQSKLAQLRGKFKP